MQVFKSAIQNERGIAALVGVCLTCLIISMLVVGFTGAMTNAVRQATDSASSVSAYYAAESGAAQAEYYIINQLKQVNPDGTYTYSLGSLNQGCKPQLSGPAGDPVGIALGHLQIGGQNTITCRAIIADAGSTDTLTADNSGSQYDLTGIKFDKLHLSWDRSGQVDFANNQFDGTSADSGPAQMELTMTTFLVPDSASGPATVNSSFIGSAVQESRILLAPCGDNNTNYTDGVGTTTCGYNTVALKRATTATQFLYQDDIPVNYVNCNALRDGKLTDGGMICGVDITPVDPVGPAPAGSHYEHVLRVRTPTGASQYHLQLFDTTSATPNTPIPNALRLANARIDITAQVGDAYRRIIETIPVRSGAYAAYDDAIYSDTRVCKDFDVVTNGVAGYMGVTYGTCPIVTSSPY